MDDRQILFIVSSIHQWSSVRDECCVKIEVNWSKNWHSICTVFLKDSQETWWANIHKKESTLLLNRILYSKITMVTVLYLLSDEVSPNRAICVQGFGATRTLMFSLSPCL